MDGNGCRTICPLPHQQLGNVLVKREDVERLDAMSCKERYEQIKDQLSPDESALLLSLILHISGGTLENSSLWDMIRSHALAAHSSDNFEDVWLLYKLRQGQSNLSRAMLDEAIRNGMEYSFSTEVSSIVDIGTFVEVSTTSGLTFRASKVISTIPLNVLRHIRFEPPLSKFRQEAVNLGHVNFMNKIHAEVKGPGLASWNGMAYPNLLLYGYGDGVLDNGNAHIVAFGKDERDHYVAENCPEETVEAFQKLHQMDIQKMVSDRVVTVISRKKADLPILDLPQLEHGPLLARRTGMVATKVYDPVPGRTTERTWEHPFRLGGLGAWMEGIH